MARLCEQYRLITLRRHMDIWFMLICTPFVLVHAYQYCQTTNLSSQSSTTTKTVPQNNMVRTTTPLFMANDNEPSASSNNFVERGVSMDQDGKSNVWAIEPKMEIENKSTEEKTGGALIAVGGFAVFAAVAAGVLSNLPDPDQF